MAHKSDTKKSSSLKVFNLISSTPAIQKSVHECIHQQSVDTQLKTHILDWFYSKDIKQRSNILTVTDPQIALIMRFMYQKFLVFGEKYFRVVCHPTTSDLSVEGIEQLENFGDGSDFEQLYRHCLVVKKQKAYDSLTVSLDQLEKQSKLLELLELEDHENDWTTYKQFKQALSLNVVYEKSLTENKYRTISGWLAHFFKLKIAFTFYQATEDDKIDPLKLKINKTWKSMNEAEKKKVVNMKFGKESVEGLLKSICCPRFKHKFIFEYEEIYRNEIKQYLKDQIIYEDDDVYSLLTSSTLEETLTIDNLFKFFILDELTNYGTKSTGKKNKMKKNKQNAYCERTSPRSTVVLENKSLSPKTTKKLIKTTKHIFDSQKKKPNPAEREGRIISNMSISNLDQCEPVSIEFLPEKNQKSITSNQTNQTSIVYNQESPDDSDFTQQNHRIKVNGLLEEKLNQDLNQTTDMISEAANLQAPAKIMAFNRIQAILLYWNIKVNLFGSCATGLALADSDIDLAIDPAILSYYYNVAGTNRDKVCVALQSIHDILGYEKWIQNRKLITSASVPILKLEIDLRNPFLQNANDPALNIVQKHSALRPVIKVDITIEYFDENHEKSNHLGISATNIMNAWKSSYPSLHSVTLLFKYLLKEKQLSNVYKGGLSSYAIMIMIIAYLNIKKLTEESNPTKILYGFLQFFTSQFDNYTHGIDISPDNPTYPLFEVPTDKKDKRKIMVKDPLNAKIVTLNSYQYPKILELMESLKEIKSRVYRDISQSCYAYSEIDGRCKYLQKNYLSQFLAV